VRKWGGERESKRERERKRKKEREREREEERLNRKKERVCVFIEPNERKREEKNERVKEGECVYFDDVGVCLDDALHFIEVLGSSTEKKREGGRSRKG